MTTEWQTSKMAATSFSSRGEDEDASSSHRRLVCKQHSVSNHGMTDQLVTANLNHNGNNIYSHHHPMSRSSFKVALTIRC
uniref:Uncharacterized protein n=1 Tax=Anguilla anguilla TaxID=7936 RepID=A0A0E9X908_ANGAN